MRRVSQGSNLAFKLLVCWGDEQDWQCTNTSDIKLFFNGTMGAVKRRVPANQLHIILVAWLPLQCTVAVSESWLYTILNTRLGDPLCIVYTHSQSQCATTGCQLRLSRCTESTSGAHWRLLPMHVCICICIFICICICVCICTCIYICVYICIYIYIFICICIWTEEFGWSPNGTF